MKVIKTAGGIAREAAPYLSYRCNRSSLARGPIGDPGPRGLRRRTPELLIQRYFVLDNAYRIGRGAVRSLHYRGRSDLTNSRYFMGASGASSFGSNAPICPGVMLLVAFSFLG
eukprot:1714162-Pyramimonas_sp.AAC.1